jgi:hypothetical protein
MYPPVRQLQNSDIYRRLALDDLEPHPSPRRLGGRAGWLGAALAAVLAAAAVYATGAGGARAATACTAGTTTVGGSAARVFCGPATAVVAFAGKTFRFSSGACTTSPGFTVNIGTLILGTAAKARPYFGVFLTAARPGTYSGKQAAVSFASGATRVSLAPTASSRVVLGSRLRSGSFTGRDILGRPLSGSFHC